MFYIAKANYRGLWNKKDQKVAERLLHKGRNELVSITNPLLGQFNEEWWKLHPEVKTMEEGSDIYNEYNKYMANKMNDVTTKVRLKYKLATGFDIYFDPDTDAQLVVSNGTGKAFITLEEIL